MHNSITLDKRSTAPIEQIKSRVFPNSVKVSPDRIKILKPSFKDLSPKAQLAIYNKRFGALLKSMDHTSLKKKLQKVKHQMYDEINREESVDFLYYMNQRMEISRHNDNLRAKIFQAYANGYGTHLETKLLRKIRHTVNLDDKKLNELQSPENVANKEIYK